MRTLSDHSAPDEYGRQLPGSKAANTSGSFPHSSSSFAPSRSPDLPGVPDLPHSADALGPTDSTDSTNPTNPTNPTDVTDALDGSGCADAANASRPVDVTGFTLVAAEAMVPRMRLLLAACALMTILIDSSDMVGSMHFAWMVAAGYLMHSLVIYGLQELRGPSAGGRLVHWGDVGWIAVIVATTGGIDSLFFLFFLFAILTVSFRYGLEEGTRVTVASAVLFASCVLLPGYELDLPRLLMRTAFLLGFGYMSAHWGESRVRNAQRLALLREVSGVSNPRFGVDRTVSVAMERVLDFFQAQACLLVLRDAESGACTLRSAKSADGGRAGAAEPVHEDAARRLLALPAAQVCAYSRPLGWRPLSALRASALPGPLDVAVLGSLSDLLEANAFISAPVRMQRGSGRIYVVSSRGRYSHNDALFLNQAIAQAFAVVDNIDLLDCIASQAAAVERRKMGWDLHDAAIQPYVGLQLGLSALRNKAMPGNPLIEDLDKLLHMANEVIADLRHFAGRLSQSPHQREPVFLDALRRKVKQVREFYGIELTLTAEDLLGLSDRVAAEALHIISEGLSNICKHTTAQRGGIWIRCESRILKICIENEGAGGARPSFIPRSISERARALGGKVAVRAGSAGGVAVHVEIPI